MKKEEIKVAENKNQVAETEVGKLQAIVETQGAEIAELLKKIEALEDQLNTSREAFDTAEEQVESLRKENEKHVADFVALDEKNKELEKALVAATKTPAKKKPIKIAVSWQTPQGEEVDKKVTINIGKVRIPNVNTPVSTEGFLKVCAGKTLTDNEKKQFEGLTKEAAIDLLTHWAKIGVGYIVE